MERKMKSWNICTARHISFYHIPIVPGPSAIMSCGAAAVTNKFPLGWRILRYGSCDQNVLVATREENKCQHLCPTQTQFVYLYQHHLFLMRMYCPVVMNVLPLISPRRSREANVMYSAGNMSLSNRMRGNKKVMSMFTHYSMRTHDLSPVSMCSRLLRALSYASECCFNLATLGNTQGQSAWPKMYWWINFWSSKFNSKDVILLTAYICKVALTVACYMRLHLLL